MTITPLRFLRLPDVINRTGLGRSSIYREMAAGRFPLQVKVGAMACWVESEVVAWQQARLQERDGERPQLAHQPSSEPAF
jgi:prophage regulatory protein